MSKLSYEDKINIYSDKKNGMSTLQISNKYKVRETTIKYIYRLVEVEIEIKDEDGEVIETKIEQREKDVKFVTAFDVDEFYALI